MGQLAQWPPSNTTWFVLYVTTTGQLAQIWWTMKNTPRPGWRTRSRNGTRFPQALISSYKILQQHWEITYRENSSSHDVREEDRMQQLRAATKLTTRRTTRRMQQLRAATKLTTRPSSYEISNTSTNTDANTQCSRRRQNFVSHKGESFAQQECDVITACLQQLMRMRQFCFKTVEVC